MSVQFLTGRPALSTKAYIDRIRKLAKRVGPTCFKLRCRLPSTGRVDIPVAATDRLNLVLKAYASGGENAVHAHTAEDHAFIVLQGEATFFGRPGDSSVTIKKHEGILIPNGVFYKFKAGGDEQLVLLRVSAVLPGTSLDVDDTIGLNGRPLDSYSKENHEVPVTYSFRRYFS
jgi:mannose-6-phosphate isomerase-like protein (cupin superfamily)